MYHIANAFYPVYFNAEITQPPPPFFFSYAFYLTLSQR